MANIIRRRGRNVAWSLLVCSAAFFGCVGPKFDATADLGSTLGVEAGNGATRSDGGDAAYVSALNVQSDASSSGDAEASTPGASSAAIAATPIDFWQVECGAFASRAVPVENKGNAPLTVHASTTGPAFAVAPTALTLSPAESGTFTVTANVPTSATAGSPISGTLSLQTNDPLTPTIDITLAVTPLGATLVFGPGGVPDPSEANFGPHTIGENADRYAKIALTLLNSGNQAAIVSVAPPSDPQFSLQSGWIGSPKDVADAGPATLDPSAILPNLLELWAVFRPTAEGESTATSRISVTGAVCGDSVKDLLFSGRGTPNGLSGWPTPPLIYYRMGSGPPGCSTPTPISTALELYNTGSTDVTLTSFVFDTAGYSTSIPAGTKVPAGSRFVVPISGPAPQASPGPTTYEAGFTVTTDALGDVPHPIQIIVKCL